MSPKRGKTSTPSLTEPELTDLLRIRFAAPEYAYLPKVRSATGYPDGKPIRTADAMAMSLWKTRGYELNGFEIKSARSDWLRELKEPAKAEEIGRYCHRWWVVAGSKDVVKAEELPQPWGLLVPRGGKLHAVVKAPLLEPDPISYPFLAALLRRLTEDYVEPAVAWKQIEDAVKEAKAEERVSTDSLVSDRWKKRAEQLEGILDAFAKASGIDLRRHDWELGPIGEVVLAIAKQRMPQMIDRLAGIDRQISELAKRSAAALEVVRSSTPKPSPPEEADTPTGGGLVDSDSSRSTTDATAP